ncbi:MAG: hypothetical protein N2555_06230 [Endomicrobia bacterium]|nr:hypothetical protein [Endomicrobiia bacterium]
MFHVKHYIFFVVLILPVIIFTQIIDSTTSYILNSEDSRYDKFLKEYRFKIYAGKKFAGFINLKISSTTDGGYVSTVDGKTEIPILFFLGDTETSEVEHYNNVFLPVKSTLVTLKGDTQVVTITEMLSNENNCYRYSMVKKGKKYKEVELTLANEYILTAGNAIPVVSTTWNFYVVQSATFTLIDKQFLKTSKIKFNYLGKTEAGEHKVEVILPYVGTKFFIYLDNEKNIKYAEGMGLKIYAE